MKIYFAWSIKGADTNKETYPIIIEHLKQHGTVLTEHIGIMVTDPSQNIAQTPNGIFTADTDMINQANILIAEITAPSLGVGRELCYAQHVANIPVHCLYQAGHNISRMITGNPYIQTHPYQHMDQITKILTKICNINQ